MNATATVICEGYCNLCSDLNVGTHVRADDSFVCGNCDPDTFDREAERQKARYLAGAKFDSKGVY